MLKIAAEIRNERTSYIFPNPAKSEDKIYDRLYSLLKTKIRNEEKLHTECANASSWCDIASVGETYETDYGITVEITEIDI